MQKTLSDILDRLNPAQLSAVTTIDGPVMAIAGPGTGKTEVLAARIAHIIESTGTPASAILCLTYTDAGAVAMRTRLQQFIGADAYQATICTFHSFCSSIINEQTDYFGASGLSPVSELEQLHLIQEIVDGFPASHPLARATGDIYFEVKRLKILYNTMKQEGWTPGHIVEQTDRWISSLADDPEYQYKRAGKAKDGTPYKKGDLNQGKILEATRKGEQLKAAALSYGEYQQKLAKANRYDFADMILWCVDLFNSSQVILESYHDKYQYILVDEFQDTGGAQYELLKLLTSSSDSPNVFVVGDDDQSIFRFQGASIENIRMFADQYADGLQTITLTENYRSTQAILDAASELIARNTERLSLDKSLTAQTEGAGQPYLRRYATQAQETADVVDRIASLHAQQVSLESIAVIYRNHRQADDIIKALSAKGIPYTTRQRIDVLKDPLTGKLINLLSYLDSELEYQGSGEKHLFTLLHDAWFGVSPLAAAKVATAVSRSDFTLTWRDCLSGSSRLDILTDDERSSLVSASTLLEDLISTAANCSVADLLATITTKLGLLDSCPNKQWVLLVLSTIHEFVRTEEEKGPLSLSRLIRLLNDMITNNIQMPVVKPGATSGVNLVTAHGSKGLEFDVVYMIGCTAKAWDSSGKCGTYSFPPTLWRSTVGNDEEESRRLFYVAMTRAKQDLYISWPVRDNQGKELEASRFVSEVQPKTGEPVDVSVTDASVEGLLASVVSQTEFPASDLFNRDLINSLLENYSLSVTHLNRYLKCPTAFYFENLLRVPQPGNAAMTFGSALHYALELACKEVVAHGSVPEDQVVDAFSRYMARHANCFTQAEYKRRLEYGESLLRSYYASDITTWTRASMPEQKVKAVYAGVPINGKLDKVELLTTSSRTVDYKSGKFSNARKKLQAPDFEKTEGAMAQGKPVSYEDRVGGDYWRQAVFYRLLDIQSPVAPGKPVTETVFDFIEPDQDGNTNRATIEVSDHDLEVVGEQIIDTYGRIQRHEFAQGCGDPDCVWCGFKISL